MRTVINGLLALVVSAVMIVCHRLLLPIVGDNWNLWGLLAVIYFIVAPVIVMIYFQFIDGYVRRWEWEREQTKQPESYTLTTDVQPTTWVLETKFKELTDEEIIEIAKDCGYANRYEYNIRFAKAILRKAQEK